MFNKKKILVTGGTGMIGFQLCKLLIEKGAYVFAASLDKKPELPDGLEFLYADLRSNMFLSGDVASNSNIILNF